MAFSLYKTSRYARVYREDQGDNTWQGFMKCSQSPMHYESVPGSGEYDTTIDVEAVATTTALLDGFEQTGAAYNSELQTVVPGSSTEQPNTQRAQGTVTYSRGGDSVSFKAISFGYLQVSTGTTTDVSGAFDYSTLPTLTEQTRDLGSHASVPSEVITYNSINEYPAVDTIGGEDFRCLIVNNPESLLHLSILSGVMRSWIRANDDNTTPNADTRVGLLFEMDWSNVTTVELPDGTIVDPSTDSFSTSRGDIKLRDANGDVFAYLPESWVFHSTFGFRHFVDESICTRTFWEDGGTTYCHMGQPIAGWDQQLQGAMWFEWEVRPFIHGRNRETSCNEIPWPYYFEIPWTTSGSDDIQIGNYFDFWEKRGGLVFNADIPGGASVDQVGEYANLFLTSSLGYTNSYTPSEVQFHMDRLSFGNFANQYDKEETILEASEKWNTGDGHNEIGGSNWSYTINSATADLNCSIAGTVFPAIDVSAPLQECLDLPGFTPELGMRMAVTERDSAPAGGYYSAVLQTYAGYRGNDPYMEVFFTAPVVDKRHNAANKAHNHDDWASTDQHKSLDKRHNQ